MKLEIKEREPEETQEFQQNPTGFPVAQHRSLLKFKGLQAKNTTKHARNEDFRDSNAAKVAQMTIGQLAEARSEIYSALSQNSIDFLMKRRAAKETETRENVDSLETARAGTETVETTPESRADPDPQVSRYIDPATADLEKLEWITQPLESGKDRRFDFNGLLIASDATIPSHVGLNHHSDSQAGYTIEQLLLLSKSTVPSQRAIALQTVGRILVNVYSGDFSDADARLVLSQLWKGNALIAMRIGIDERHETVVVQALHCMFAVMGCVRDVGNGQSFLDLCHRRSLLEMGHVSLAYSSESIEAFKSQALGQSFDKSRFEFEKDNIEQIGNALKVDYVSGLLNTNILVRFRYLLEDQSLPLASRLEIIEILTVFAAHSVDSTEDILACAGLVDAIKYLLFSDYSNVSIVSPCVRLFRVIAGASREACQALVKDHIVHDMLRFLALLPKKLDSVSVGRWKIATEVMGLLSVCFVFRMAGPILDDYRPIFFELGKDLNAAFRTLDSTNSHVDVIADAFAALNNMCRNALLSFRPQMDAGGANDALLPLVIYAASTISITNNVPFFTQIDNLPLHCCTIISSGLLLFAVYLEQAKGFKEELAESAKGAVTKILDVFQSVDVQTYLEKLEEPGCTVIDSLNTEKGIGAVTRQRLEAVSKLLAVDEFSLLLKSVLHLNLACVKGGYLSSDALKNLLLSRQVTNFIERYVWSEQGLVQEGDWLRQFVQSRNAAVTTWIACIDYFSDEDDLDAARKLVYPAAFSCLGRLLPGDDFIGSKLVGGYILSSRWQAHKLPSSLQGILVKLLINPDSVQFSRVLYGEDRNDKLGCLRLQCQDRISVYPIRQDWVFSAFPQLFRLQATSSSEHVFEQVLALLTFVKYVETHQSSVFKNLDSAVKLVSIMHVFLLTDSAKGDFFREDAAQDLLKWAFQYYSPEVSNLETAFQYFNSGKLALKTKFYDFYQDLLDHFVNVSFGDAVFSQYLILPLSMDYAADYRLLFWNTLGRMLRVIGLTEKDLPRSDIQPFISPRETDAQLLRIYREAIDSQAITAEHNRVLFQIASKHLE